MLGLKDKFKKCGLMYFKLGSFEWLIGNSKFFLCILLIVYLEGIVILNVVLFCLILVIIVLFELKVW